jgi:hypothetical protein
MRRLKITRKKSFFGAVIPYFLFVGYRKAETDPLNPHDEWDFPATSDVKIANGQTLEISIRDEKCCVFVETDTSTGIVCSPKYSIDEGTADIELELVTQYSWTRGSRYVLKPVSARPYEGKVNELR